MASPACTDPYGTIASEYVAVNGGTLPSKKEERGEFGRFVLKFWEDHNRGLGLLNAALGSTFYLEHISNTQKQILEGARGLSGEALVLGLGDGEEPLKELAEQFDTITVVDVDEEGMQRAVARTGHPAEKFHIVRSDLTGLLGPFSLEIEEMLSRKPLPPFEEVAQKITSRFRSFEPPCWELPGKKFSYVVSSLVSTQLAAQFRSYVLRLLEEYYPQDVHSFRNNEEYQKVCGCLSIDLQQRHMESLWHLVLPHGRAYFADTVESFPVKRDYKMEIVAVEAPHTMVAGCLFHYANQLFHCQETGKWVWSADTPDPVPGSSGTYFNVKSMLLTPKS